MKRILPFPRKPLPITKVWNDDEQPASTINDKTVSDFTRVVDQTGILNPDHIDELAALMSKNDLTGEEIAKICKLMSGE